MKISVRRGSGERLVWCTWVIVFTVVVTSAEAVADEPVLKEEIRVAQSHENHFPAHDNFSSTDSPETATAGAYDDDKHQEGEPVNYEGAQVITVRLKRKSQRTVIEKLVNENRMFISF
jgi:hypothetical protein